MPGIGSVSVSVCKPASDITLEAQFCLVQNLLALSTAVCLGPGAISKKIEAHSTQLHFFCTSVNLYQQQMAEPLGRLTRPSGSSLRPY